MEWGFWLLRGVCYSCDRVLVGGVSGMRRAWELRFLNGGVGDCVLRPLFWGFSCSRSAFFFVFFFEDRDEHSVKSEGLGSEGQGSSLAMKHKAGSRMTALQ